MTRAILFGGAATLAVTAIWIVKFPVLSRMDKFPHHEKEDAVRDAAAKDAAARAAAKGAG